MNLAQAVTLQNNVDKGENNSSFPEGISWRYILSIKAYHKENCLTDLLTAYSTVQSEQILQEWGNFGLFHLVT